MKKLFSLLLALTMLLPVLASAEGTPDLGVIGGADGPTSMFAASPMMPLFGDLKLPTVLGEEAVAAGRRVVNTLKVTELSGVPLETEEEKQALADIINALTLVDSLQGDEEIVKVQLSGKDVLTLGAALSGKDAYINSDLLGGTIVVAEDEAEGLLNRVLDLLVSMGAVSEEDAASVRSTIQMLPAMIEEAQAQPAQMANLLAELEKLDYTALTKAMELAVNQYEAIEEPTVPRMCDPAVMGLKASFDNEEMQQLAQCIFQFVQDNPAVMDYLAMLTGIPTEKQIEEAWAANKELYESMGITEEVFRASMQTTQTMDSIIAEAMELTRTRKLIEGEYVISVYADAEGMPVYITADLPLYIEEENLTEPVEGEAPQQEGEAPQQTGHVMPISVTYTRQTLADGVDHVCNIAVDGETMSIDVLTAENGMKLTMDGIYANGTVEKLLDLTTKTQSGATESDPDTLTAEMNLYEGEEQPAVKLLLEGECVFNDVRSYFAGKLTITEVASGIDIVMSLNSDTAINGVDFTGKANMTVQMADVRFGIETDYMTTDPVESIMAGQVIRPAELDDNAFTEWFTNVLTSLNTWQANALAALPQSVLMLMLPQTELPQAE